MNTNNTVTASHDDSGRNANEFYKTVGSRPIQPFNQARAHLIVSWHRSGIHTNPVTNEPLLIPYYKYGNEYIPTDFCEVAWGFWQ